MAKFVQRTVYLSYRYPLNQWQARTITLVLEKYGFSVLRAEPSMKEQTALKQIEAHAHFVLLLAPQSLLHIEQRGDRLRKEIDHAIQKKRNIIVVLLEGFTLEAHANSLRVGKLRQLSQMKSLIVPNNYIKESILTLVSASYLMQPTEINVIEPAKRFQEEAETARADNTLVPTETNGMTALDHYYRGLSFSEFGNHENAIEAYTQAIRLDASFDDAVYDRGFAYGLLGNFEQAITDYTLALSLNPDEANTYYNRAYAYEQLKQYPEALADYRQTLELSPQDEDAHVALKRISALLPIEPTPAIADDPTPIESPMPVVVVVEEVEEPSLLEEPPQDEEVLVVSEEVEEPFIHAEDAESIAEVAPAPLTLDALTLQLEATPGDAELLHQRASLYQAQGDYLKGFNDIFHALSQSPNDPRYLYTRAMICKGLGLYEQAIADLNFVRRLYPQLVQQVEFKFHDDSVDDETA